MKKIQLFDLFISSLKDFENQDKALYLWQKNRIALIHALSLQIEKKLEIMSTNIESADALTNSLTDTLKENGNLNVDICPFFSDKELTLNPDIIVHNRKTKKIILSVVCRHSYLSEAEQLMLFKLSRKCELCLAVSFFTRKNHMLLYHASENEIEYFHFDRNTLTVNQLRTKRYTTEDSHLYLLY